MAALEFPVNLLPALLGEICDLVGLPLTLRFARTFSGRKVYFPQRIYSSHPIAACVGHRAAQLICQRLGGEERLVPSCKGPLNWFEARALKVLGCNNAQIAQKLELGPRWVTRLLEGFDPAGVEITDAIRGVGRRYGIGGRRGGRDAAPMGDRPQLDFGFAPDRRGLRLTDA